MLNKFFDSLDDQSIPIPTLLRYLSSPLETSSFSLEPTVLNHIFKIIRTNSSFFNYDLVEYMIDLTGTQDDKKRLGEYKAEFIAYAQRRIYECPSTFGATLTPNDTELHVKLDSHYDSCKASELKEFQYRLRLTFKLKRLYARLLSIEQGCLKLVYAIPKHVVETTFPLSAEQKEALKECGVVELTCSHYQFLQKEQSASNKGQSIVPEVKFSENRTVSVEWKSASSSRTTTTFLEKIASLPQTLQGWLSGSNSVNMLVTGKTGIGKSSLINAVVGKEVAEEGDTLDRGTVTVQAFSFKYHEVDITIWDSPGLQDGLDKEEDYIRDMQRKGCANSDLVLYCAKMTDTRFRKEDHDAIRKLTKGLGKDIWKNAIFVMTFANEVRARREHGQKLTPDEERKRNHDYFKERLELYKTKLVDAVVEAGVDGKIAASIPIVPAGYDEEQELPDRDNWLSPLWYASILRMKEHSQPALLKANLHRIKLPDQITPDDFDKPLHKQPIIYMPAPYKYGAPPTVFAVIGALVESVAGLAGALAGGAIDATLGGATDGLIAYFTSGGSETESTDSKNDEQ